MEKLTISSKIDNEFEFDITASGVDLKTGRVMFCVEIDKMLTYQIECTHKVGVKWVVKFPKGILENGLHKFKIAVLIEDFYFEPMKGRLTVIDAEAIKITETKDDKVEVEVEVEKEDDKVEVEVEVKVEKKAKLKPKAKPKPKMKPKLESVAILTPKPKPTVEEKPVETLEESIEEVVTTPAKKNVKEAAIQDVISSSFKQSAKTTRNKKKSEKKLEQLQERSIEDLISKKVFKTTKKKTKTFFETDHPYEYMEDGGAKDKKAREILAGLKID